MARGSAKGIPRILESGKPGFEAAFEKLCRRRDEHEEDVDLVERRARRDAERSMRIALEGHGTPSVGRSAAGQRLTG